MKKLLNIQKRIKQNDFWKNLVTNSFWAFCGDSISSVINLLITIILIKMISDNGYGTLVVAQSYMLVMDVLINIQSWKSVIRYGQQAITSNNDDDLYGYVKLGCILDISTAILGGILSYLFASIIGSILNWNSELILCAELFSFTIFSHFSGTPTAILRLLNKFNLVAAQKIISSLVKLGAFIYLLFFQSNISLIFSVIVYVITDILGNLILIIFSIYVFSKKYSIKRLLKSGFPAKKNEFIRYTLWGTFSDILDIPVNYFDVFILSFLSTQLVAVLKVFKQIISILSKVTTPIYQAILPQFSELSALGREKYGFNIVLKIQKAILLIMGPISLIIGFSSPFWLRYIYGELYAQYWIVLLLFLAVQTLALSYTTVHPYFISIGKAKESSYIVLIANLIYIIVSILLIQKIGMLALVVSYFLQSSIVIGLKILSIKKEL